MLILGYFLLNASLITDFVNSLKRVPNSEGSILSALAVLGNGPYMETVESKTATGTTQLNVEDCYLFETDQGTYYAQTAQGRATIGMSLAELENRLDPDRFFRGNRHYIINLDHFESHTYWDKGKYVLRSRKLPGRDLVMPRARWQSLKEALNRNQGVMSSRAGLMPRSDDPPADA